MKLQELAALSPTKQIAKVFESYFGSNIEFDRLTYRQTQHLLQRVQGLLREHRSGSERYQSQQNPGYLKLVMMEQALSSRLQENVIPPGTAPATPQAAVAGGTPAVAGAVAKDPKFQHDTVAVLGAIKKETISDVSLVANGIQHFEGKQMDMLVGGVTKVGGALSGPIMIAGAVVGLIIVYKLVKG
jgi:hypothetical protein